MVRIRQIMLSMLAVLAVGAVSATAARATEGPFYRIEGTGINGARLEASESENIINAQTNAAGFVLKAGTVEIKCTALNATGILIGSNVTNGSGSKETITFEGCTVTGNGSPCASPTTIKTVPLIDRLAYAADPPVTGTKLLVVFAPEKKGKRFVPTIVFTGTGCVDKEINVELATGATGVCGEAWSGGAVVAVNGANETERKVGEINFPAAAIKKPWEEDSGVLTERICGLIITGGIAATLTGRSSFELEDPVANAVIAKWGVFTK